MSLVIAISVSFVLPSVIWLLAPGPGKLLAMLPLLPGLMLQSAVSRTPQTDDPTPFLLAMFISAPVYFGLIWLLLGSEGRQTKDGHASEEEGPNS